MVNLNAALLIAITALLGATDAQAKQELIEFYRGVRAMGMGNAFTALSDDADAVFYNPAGIGHNSGVQLRLVNPKFEVSKDSLTLAKDIKGGASSGLTAETMNKLFGKNVYGSGTVYPSVLFPYFTVGYYAGFNAHAVVNNKALPTININYYQDQGIIGGTGYDVGIGKFSHLRFGASVKALSRKGVNRVVPITTLVAGGNVVKSLVSTSAFGFGITPGLQYEHPLSPRTDMVYGVVWHDVGDTKFGSRLSDSSRAPPSIPSNLAAGAAIIQRFSKREGYNAKFSVEGRHLNRLNEDPRKKMHVGAELRLGALAIQGGLNQLRWTAGVLLDLWAIELAASSYAVENLSFWGQGTERRYALQLTMKLDASSTRDRRGAEADRRKRPRLNK
jgi:hypothetical protein